MDKNGPLPIRQLKLKIQTLKQLYGQEMCNWRPDPDPVLWKSHTNGHKVRLSNGRPPGMVEVQLKQDAYMEVGGRQCLEHIVEQLTAKTDCFSMH